MNKRNILRHTARTVALLLSLITVCASMASCDGDNPFENFGKTFTISLPEVEVKTKEEITADGITAEEVLAIYDQLAQNAQRARTETTEYLTEADINAQFTSITVAKREITYDSTWTMDNYYVRNTWFLPQVAAEAAAFAEDRSAYSPYIAQDIPEAYMGHCYQVNFNFISESFGIGTNETIESWGIFSVKFEKVMTLFDVEKHTFSEEDYPTEGIDRSGDETYVSEDELATAYGSMLGRNAYEPLIIDRALIESANEEQLWALYDMAVSMADTNIKGTLPSGCIDITVTEEDYYGKTVTIYNYLKTPISRTVYDSYGNVTEKYDYTFNADGQLTQMTYYEGGSSQFTQLFKQIFSEEGKLTKAVLTVAYEGYTVYKYEDEDPMATAFKIDDIQVQENFNLAEVYNTTEAMQYYVVREYYSEGSYNDTEYTPDGSIRY